MKYKEFQRQILRLLEKLKIDSFVVQVYEGTLFSNLLERKLPIPAFPRSRQDNVKVEANQKIKIPPANLRRKATGTTEAHSFIWSGRLNTSRILDLLNVGGFEIEKIKNILDFGCGCGRLARHFLMLGGNKNVFGSDIEPSFIKWCQTNINLERFKLNNSNPRLHFSNGQFDLIVCYSVFTHMPEEEHLPWLLEIGRTLKHGGAFVFSTHAINDIRKPNMAGLYASTEEIKKFDSGEIVATIINKKNGGNPWFLYDTYHPKTAILKLAKDSGVFSHRITFPALEVPPMTSAGHDLHLWQKLNAPGSFQN